MSRVVDGLWLRLPSAAGRLSRTLAAILGDGRYARAWPPVALLGPVAALAVGLVLGAEDTAIYTTSISTMSILAVTAGFGAAVGLWAWVGFVLGDLLLRDPAQANIWGVASGPTGFAGLYVPLLISYVVLAGLLVLSPLIGSGCRFRATTFARSSPLFARLRRNSYMAAGAGFAVQVIVQAAYAEAWIHSTPFLIRPLWTYSGLQPDTASIQPLQTNGSTLIAVTIGAVTARGILTVVAERRDRAPRSAGRSGLVLPSRRPLPIVVSIPLRAAFLTLLFSGLLASKGQAILLAGVLAGILTLQAVVFPRIGRLTDLLGRIPLLVRLAVISALSAWIGHLMVAPAVTASQQSFSPMVTSIAVSLLIAGLLLSPDLRRRQRPPQPQQSDAPEQPLGAAAAHEDVGQ